MFLELDYLYKSVGFNQEMCPRRGLRRFLFNRITVQIDSLKVLGH